MSDEKTPVTKKTYTGEYERAPIHKGHCLILAEKLKQRGGLFALDLMKEAYALADIFEEWIEKGDPGADSRQDTKRRYVTLRTSCKDLGIE